MGEWVVACHSVLPRSHIQSWDRLQHDLDPQPEQAGVGWQTNNLVDIQSFSCRPVLMLKAKTCTSIVSIANMQCYNRINIKKVVDDSKYSNYISNPAKCLLNTNQSASELQDSASRSPSKPADSPTPCMVDSKEPIHSHGRTRSLKTQRNYSNCDIDLNFLLPSRLGRHFRLSWGLTETVKKFQNTSSGGHSLVSAFIYWIGSLRYQ